PHRSSISSRTRFAVHSPVAYPSASGPRLSACSSCLSWAPLSLGLRPARPAFFKPALPDCASCRAQRITNCRCTPQAPRHLTLTHAPLKQFRCLHPAPLQRAEVPPHTCWITHTSRIPYVSILYKSQ